MQTGHKKYYKHFMRYFLIQPDYYSQLKAIFDEVISLHLINWQQMPIGLILHF